MTGPYRHSTGSERAAPLVFTPAQARDRLTKLRLARAFIGAAGLLLVFAMVWR